MNVSRDASAQRSPSTVPQHRQTPGRARRVLFLAGVALLLAACGGDGDDDTGEGGGGVGAGGAAGACADETRAEPFAAGMTATSAGGVAVTVETASPARPTVGANAWELVIKDAAGAPVEGARVRIKRFMPDHGHGGVGAITIVEQAGGRYAAEGVAFNMGGYWEVTVEVLAAGAAEDTAEDARLKICIE